MWRPTLALMTLSLFGAPSGAAGPIGPEGFAQLWQTHNQRQLIKRNLERRAAPEAAPVFRLALDSTQERSIQSNLGEVPATLNRMEIDYRTARYQFLMDWTYLLPEPNTAGGLSYGDLVVSRRWAETPDGWDHTLGLRAKSTPGTTELGGQRVFDITQTPREDLWSLFYHLNIAGYDLGTYVSEGSRLDALALSLPWLDAGPHRLGSTLIRFDPQGDLPKSRELSLDYAYRTTENHLATGLTLADPAGLERTWDLHARLTRSYASGFSYTLGLYRHRDEARGQAVNGAQLGIAFALTGAAEERFSLGLYFSRNAFGDYSTLLVEDEGVISFVLSSTN